MTDRGQADGVVGHETGDHPDIVVVVEGADKRVLAFNRAARSVFSPGTDPDEHPPMAEMSFGDQVVELSDQAFETGEELIGEEASFHVRKPDGTVVEMLGNFTLTPWHGEDGRVNGVIARASDVTVREGEDDETPMVGPRPEASLDVVRSLQDALLPGDLPVVPGVDVAACYLLATGTESAGGDWFDAIVRPDGTLAIVVGDVVGHGVAAAAVMGQLRAVLHDRLLSGEPIGAALAALDRFAQVRRESHGASVCVVQLDTDTGAIEYCTAGHPPPLVVMPGDGDARFLVPSRAGPLATGRDFPVAEDQLDPEDLVLLYTDGIVERPGTTLTESTIDLSRVAAHTARDQDLTSPATRAAERVCQLALERLVQLSGYADDILLMAAQRVPRIAPLELRLPGTPTSITRARIELRRWLDAHDLRALDDLSVHHAVGELVTNSVQHAFDGSEAAEALIEVDAHLDRAGQLVCSVRDNGRWRTPDRSSSGQGIALVRGLVDELELTHGVGGTTAILRHRLSRPAQLLTASGQPDQPTRQRAVPFTLTMEQDLLVVRGALDQVSADSLRAGLLRASRGRTVALTVDLSGVTFLGSAGAQVLHEVSVIEGEPFVLLAPPGSVAQHVLEMARIAYSSEPDEALPPA